jgi:hypothetical protein
MQFRKRVLVPLDKFYQSSWHKIDPKNVKITEDLELVVEVLDIIS